MSYGHIKLSRKMFDGSDPLWSEPRRFSQAEAWIDLIQMAAWHQVQYRSDVWGSDSLTRGEFVASVRYLATRWTWSKSAVHSFLRASTKAGRIMGQRKGQHGTVYLIVNYDCYQSHLRVSRTGNGTANGTTKGHLADTSRTKTNTGKAGKAVLHHTRARSPRLGTYAPEFEQLWARYPKRAGGNSKAAAARAWTARQREGVSAGDMLTGVERYAAWCGESGKVGTEYVKMASTFLGPDRHWEQEWTAAPAVSRRLDTDGTPLGGLSMAAAMRLEDQQLAAPAHRNGSEPT